MFEMTPTYLATDDTLPGFLGRFKNKILETILSIDCELSNLHKAYIDSLDLTETERDLVKNKADYLTFSQSLPVGVKTLLFEQIIEITIDRSTRIRIWNSGPSPFGGPPKTYSGLIAVVRNTGPVEASHERETFINYTISEPLTKLPDHIVNLLFQKERQRDFTNTNQAYTNLLQLLKEKLPVYSSLNIVEKQDLRLKSKSSQVSYKIQQLLEEASDSTDSDVKQKPHPVFDVLTYPEIKINFKELFHNSALEYKVQANMDIDAGKFNIKIFGPAVVNMSGFELCLPSCLKEFFFLEKTLSDKASQEICSSVLAVISNQLDP